MSLDRRALLSGALAGALTATLPAARVDAADVLKGMSWSDAVDALAHDVRTARTEQRALVASTPLAPTSIYMKRGILAAVPTNHRAESAAMEALLRQHPATDRIASLHTHPQFTVQTVDRRAGQKLFEAVTKPDGSIVPGKEIRNCGLP